MLNNTEVKTYFVNNNGHKRIVHLTESELAYLFDMEEVIEELNKKGYYKDHTLEIHITNLNKKTP